MENEENFLMIPKYACWTLTLREITTSFER